jgi:prepilin-type N-terminal cleavage/methylation domain-containing protein
LFRNKVSGFTLIEVLIAIFILGVVLSTVYAAYTGTYRIIKISEYDRDIYRMGRMTLQRMLQDFGAVGPYNGKFELVSKRSDVGKQAFPKLVFTSTVNLGLGNQENPAGVSTIDYYVWEDPEKEESVLMRVENVHREKLLDEQTDLKKGAFPICNKLHSLIYKFYDRAGKEYENWDSTADTDMQKNRLPAVIAVELSLINPDNRDNPFKFMTKIYLPVNQVDRENMPYQ